MLDSRKVLEAANKLDKRVVKLDAGGDKTFKAVNSPLSRTNLAKVITGIRSMKDVTIQSMFCQGAIDNTKPQDIEEWLEVIAMLKPASVQIQGVSRAPTNEAIIRCDEDTLHTIASLLERRTGIKALVTP
jgi:wyosine [tRNA(Phe)-imidazoG37] synthetase (radical SAM superfamily)